MKAGEIFVAGSVGTEAGLCLRRGLIAVASSAGEIAGHHLFAGTLLIARGELLMPGVDMRRGTVIGLESGAPLLPGYARNGAVRHGWLRLLKRRLEALGFPLLEPAAKLLSGDAPLESWSGDLLSLGRGEILVPLKSSTARP